MRLRSEADLDKTLKEAPPPVILVHSDAPLLREEAAARVRRALTADPEVERVAFRAEEGLDYAAIREEVNAPSLFAPLRLIELHYGGGAPKDDGAKWLAEYAADPAPDVRLLVTCGYQSKGDQRKKWFQAVADHGAVLALFAPRREELPGWLRRRAGERGLELDRDALALLAERVEGNLEAAAGELEKLLLYTGGRGGSLAAEDVLAAVGDQARFSVFDLAEAALGREPERVVRAVASLRAEGVELPPVLGALAKELRILIALQDRAARGEDLDAACRDLKVFYQRQQARKAQARSLPGGEAETALARLARIDRVAKGAEGGDPWDRLEAAVLRLAGAPEPAAVG